MCDVPPWVDFYYKSDVQEIKDTNRVTSYLVKYLTGNSDTLDE